MVAALPDNVAVPRLQWAFDEGDEGWVVLVFDEVMGDHPAQPWQLDELDRVLHGLVRLTEMLTPSPLPTSAVGAAADVVARQLCGWQRLRQQPADDLIRLDAWSRRHLDALADLEAHAPAAVIGETLLHFDVRADNLLLTRDKVWFFDWPHARIGASWLDAVAFAPSVTSRRVGVLCSMRRLPIHKPSPPPSRPWQATSRDRLSSLRHLVCQRSARSRPPRAWSPASGLPRGPAGHDRTSAPGW